MPSTMSSETPAVSQRIVVESTTSKHDDHASSSSRLAQSSRMIDSCGWTLSFTLDFSPNERRFLNVENPTIVNALLPNVSSEYDQVRLGVREGVAVSFSGCFMRYVDDVPYSDSIPDVQMVQIVRGQASRACGASKDYDFIWFNTNSSMCSSGRWGGSGC